MQSYVAFKSDSLTFTTPKDKARKSDTWLAKMPKGPYDW